MKFSTLMKVCIQSFLLASILLLNFACSEKTSHEKHIPSNAAVVAVLDIQRMTVKAFDMSLLLEQNILDKKKEEEPDKKRVPIEDSGIDFLDKSYFIGHVADNESDNYIGLIMPINDPYKFRQFAVSYAIKKPGEGTSNVTYVSIDDGAVLGWNNESAIYLINQTFSNERALTAELFRLFDLPESNQMFLQNASFQKTLEEPADISVWMDIDKLNKYRNPLGMIIPGQRVSEGIYNAWVNFEKGSLNMKTRYYESHDDDDKQDGALVLKESVNRNLMMGINEDKILGSFNLGLNIPLIKEQMRKDGMLDSSQTYLELMNTNTEEVLDMLSGDIVSVLLEDEKQTDFFIALGIKQEATSAKIIGSLSDFGLIRQYDYYYTLFNEYFIYPEKDRLVISSDVSVIQDIHKGNNDIPHNDFLAKLETNPMLVYLDLDRLPRESYNKMKTYWKDWPVDSDEVEQFYFTQSSVNDGTSDGEAYVTFRNKDKNSLTIIAKSLKKLARNIES